MPQLLALEWNGSEARVVVAASHGEEARIEQAFSVTLEARQAGEETQEVDVGERMAAALAARGIGRLDTLVAVGRSSIELRQLALPPAPEEELPDLVRFQALREFNELDENWLLDFVPIDDATEGPRNVLAAAIDPETVAEIEQTCRTAGLKPRRLILRPCAAASLLGRTPAAGPARPRLLVDLLSDEADLTVMINRRVIFLRTARMSGDPLEDAGDAEKLVAEIRRTMAAAHNQLGGQRVESIVLCGRDQQHAALVKLIEEKLSLPTELFDPFAGLRLGRELQRRPPDHSGRFAPLLGMVLAELEQTGHAVDFLHPRHRPAPPSRHPKVIAVAVAAVLLVALFVVYRQIHKGWLQEEIKGLNARSRESDQAITDLENVETAVARIDQWTATDVVWLDELRELSQRFPPAREAMLVQLKILPGSPGGKMELEGLVDNSATIGTMEGDLQDESHRVEGTGSGAESSKAPYSWWFKSSVFVVPRPEQR